MMANNEVVLILDEREITNNKIGDMLGASFLRVHFTRILLFSEKEAGG